MRAELAQLGIEETKTSEAVIDAVKNTEGTVMVVVNSVCGCAAGGVRPGIAMALQNSEAKPDRAITVFAGADIDATETARRRDFFPRQAHRTGLRRRIRRVGHVDVSR